ncbi:putative enzyme related to lactoylglutathione lyase [Nocardia tenerifensis]|uniref:Putative enzyme related to lactoylglutathione lyase n=1 Tax=Nocardia tenerifensis TaxID=228006 RepID=A0A318JYL3_9NOCA|nr:VOC family protein [Nocardia tenerifensis]PXX59269.1 putative enzyme related to lactoylglutathione lyase [Nocardia tenerifensis]
MTITQINTITAFVSDQDRAKEFYATVLGFAVRGDQVMGENRWLEVAPGDAGTSIVLHKPFPGATPGTLSGVILGSDDVDDAVARLREAGAQVDGPIDQPWGRQATFVDPDGNSFVLQASPAQN